MEFFQRISLRTALRDYFKHFDKDFLKFIIGRIHNSPEGFFKEPLRVIHGNVPREMYSGILSRDFTVCLSGFNFAFHYQNKFLCFQEFPLEIPPMGSSKALLKRFLLEFHR